ncbi:MULTISPECIES: DUF624 domain-containing protein [Clostridia]|uniref:YesL family protein n=1 Tax=Clostridia TaxID=186801 RepID=UPI000EA015E3|nr:MULTISPECIES: DUF624 domain-containing protein [Clostridia]NBJ70827.1 DUF624 domain-containing protein [Roseburia sp. 1XD42-34]RKI75691.1 DUF624 domain-containing protein [Clostridium sp. 1xD42-85]
MHTFVNGYYRFSVWTVRLAYLNFCWMFFTILGMGVFGLMPATSAMFMIVRKWMQGEEDMPIFRLFWTAYRENFVKTNSIGFVFIFIGYFLVIEFNILRAQESFIYYIVSYSVLGTLLLYAVVLLYFFPVFVHFNLKWLDYLKWPFIIGICHPILTIFLFGVLSVVHYFVWITIPALLFFFGGSLTALFVMWAASQSFAKYETVKA